MKSYLILLAFFLLAQNISAQKSKNFPIDSASFNQEIEAFFRSVSMPETEKETIKKFMLLWNNKQFAPTEYKRINAVLNNLLFFNTRPYPDFTDYFKTINSFIENKKDSTTLRRWQESVLKLLENKKTAVSKINGYFNFTQSIISGRYIYYSRNLSWRISNDNYQFYFDKQPYLKLVNVNIQCFAKKDSMAIYQTSGTLFPLENLYIGKKGKVTWERSGYNTDSVYAKLNNFEIRTNKSEYTVDSVFFINKMYFSVEVLGKLEDQVSHVSSKENMLYPQFTAFENNYHWTEMYPRIDYDGGFSFQGSRIVGVIDGNKDVMLSLKYNDTLRMRIKSKFIVFLPLKVYSYKSKIVIYLDEDSIFHPDLTFTYFVDKQEINLTQNEDFLSKSSYVNTYHQVNMNFEQITWKVKQPFMKLTMLRSTAISTSTFKSTNFFNLYEYEKQQGMDYTNPLIIIRNYAIKNKTQTFNAVDFAHYINKPISQTKHLLMRLAVEGYVFYDAENDQVKINKTLYSTIDSRFGKIDYDVINIVSTTENPVENAMLDLNTNELFVNGIESIFLSDSQKVFVYPANGTVKMKKNRDFEFDGVIVAGLLTFFGNDFYFDYTNFKINMDNVDSLKMKAQTNERDFYNNPVLTRVNSTLEKITGDILIDDPTNKSGLQSLSQYPIFNSKKNSYLYYDDVYVQGGVYERDSFYFEVYPYSIDSLDNFNKDALTFEGYFVSDNIFPPFEEIVYIMPDNSLGFRKTTPGNGYPVYKGQGEFFKDFSISNQGLRGNGTLTYLTSKIESKDYIFFPDSLRAIADKFNISEQTTGIEYPMLESENVEIFWLPYENVLTIEQIDNPYTIYNKDTKLAGDLKLKPSGLTGKGAIQVESSKISSNDIIFQSKSFFTDTSNIVINNKTMDTSLFITKNVKCNYNFLNGIGDFKTNDDVAKIELPENRYLCFIKEFSWKSGPGIINMKSEGLVHVYDSGNFVTLPISGAEDQAIGNHFISTNPKLDSLEFSSTTSQINLNNREIYSDNVRFIHVADATIFPNEGEVTIKKGGALNTLFNAEILANRDTKLYKFYDARADIRSKNYYQGSGTYTYSTYKLEDQRIFFELIYVDDSTTTTAKAKLLETDNFLINPYFAFQGDVTLHANKELFYYEGATKMNHKCEDKTGLYWIRFKSIIDPENTFIPVPEKIKNINNQNLYLAEYITTDSTHIYPSFFAGRKDYSDEELVTARGYLNYNKNTGQYMVSSKEKIQNLDTTGTMIALNKDLCILYGEGDINLGVNFGRMVNKQVGTIVHDFETNAVRTNLIMSLDFHFSQPALDIFAFEADSIPGNKAVNLFSKSYNKKLQQFIGYNEAITLREDLNLYGSYQKLPNEFKHTIVFNNLELIWNEDTKSFRSDSEIGISNIGNTQINKLFNGNIEIIKRRSGDIIHIYIELNKDNWYLFTYTRGMMQAISSNDTYNTIIKETKAKLRRLKQKGNQQPYLYILCTGEKLSKVLARFKEGIEIPEESEITIDEELEFIEQ